MSRAYGSRRLTPAVERSPRGRFFRAFTLVELLAGIVVVGILATVAVVYYSSSVRSSKASAEEESVRTVLASAHILLRASGQPLYTQATLDESVTPGVTLDWAPGALVSEPGVWVAAVGDGGQILGVASALGNGDCVRATVDMSGVVTKANMPIGSLGCSAPQVQEYFIQDPEAMQPAPPGSVAAVPSATSATSVSLSWSEPDGSPSGYRVYRMPGVGEFEQIADVAGLSYTDTLLTTGVEYSYFITAYNFIGQSPASDTVLVTPTADAPAPAVLSGVLASSSLVDLSWTSSATDKAPIAGFRVYKDDVELTELGPDADSYTASGLTAGVTYVFKVRPFNPTGEPATAPSSESVSLTPITPPATPGAVAGTSGDGQATVSFTALGAGTAAAPNTSVGLQVCEDALMTSACDTTASTTSATSVVVSPLTNGTDYYFRLVASNAAGVTNGPTSAAVTPLAVPATPTGLTVTPVAGQSTRLTVTWNAVASTVGAPVTGYRLYRLNTGTGVYDLLATQATTSYLNTGLTAGTTYTYKVATYGTAGESEQSALVAGVPVGAPAAPGTPTVTVTGAAALSVTWTATGVGSASNPIDGVRVQYCTNSGFTTGCNTTAWLPGATAASTLSGLTAGTPLYVRLQTYNGFSTVSGSASAARTPLGLPAAPPTPTLTPSSAQIIASWTAVGAGPAASPNTSVQVWYCTDAAMTTGCLSVTGLANNTTTRTLTTLTNGTEYFVRLRSVNAAGSTDGPVASRAPYAVPATPTAPTGVIGDTVVNLTFTAVGTGTAAAPVSSVSLQYCTNNTFTTGCATQAVDAADTTASVTGLTNGTSYYFRLRAHGPIAVTNGTGSAALRPITLPTAPGAATGVTIPGRVTVSWASTGAGPAASPIVNVVVQYCTDAAMTTGCVTSALLANNTTSRAISGLTNGTQYHFRVRSINAIGTSDGPVVSATPYAAPAARPAPTVLAGSGQVTVSWAAAGSGTATAPINNVRVQSCTNTGMSTGCVLSALLPNSDTSYVMTGLAAGTPRYFRILTINTSATTNGSRSGAATPT